MSPLFTKGSIADKLHFLVTNELCHNHSILQSRCLSTMSFADSLWEFVLDDYEDEQSSFASKFSRNKKKKNKSSKSRSFLGGSKQAKRSEYRDDVQDGVWDIITGKPPKATQLRRSRSFSGTTKMSNGRNSRTRSSSLTRSQSNLSEQDTVSSDKKKGAFNPFSRKKSQKNSEPSSVREYSDQNVSVKEKALVDSRDDKAFSDDDEEFDPVDLLLTKIADTLDPWGLDSDGSFSDGDSLDGSTDGDRSSLVGSESYASVKQRSKSKNARKKKPKSPLQPTNPVKVDSSRYPYHSKQEKEGNSHTTEIRLKVNYLGTTLSEEVFEKNGNAEEDESRGVPSDEENEPLFSRSFDSEYSSSEPTSEREPNEPTIRNFEEKREIDGNAGRVPESEANRSPAIARTTEITQPPKHNESNKGSGNAKASNGLKMAMCGVKKLDRVNLTNRLRKPDTKEGFPSSRMVIDGESHLVSESDPVREVVGPMSESKGPQPVFAYDYESNMNMDVCYTSANQSPKNSMTVRKLGTPPPISSVQGEENIVIQVEVRIVYHVRSNELVRVRNWFLISFRIFNCLYSGFSSVRDGLYCSTRLMVGPRASSLSKYTWC